MWQPWWWGEGGDAFAASLWGEHPCLLCRPPSPPSPPETPPCRLPSTRTHGITKAGGERRGQAAPSLPPSLPPYAHIITAAPPTPYHSGPLPHPTSYPPPRSIVPVTRALKAGVTPADTTGPEPTDADMPPITMETPREKHPDSNH